MRTWHDFKNWEGYVVNTFYTTDNFKEVSSNMIDGFENIYQHTDMEKSIPTKGDQNDCTKTGSDLVTSLYALPSSVYRCFKVSLCQRGTL